MLSASTGAAVKPSRNQARQGGVSHMEDVDRMPNAAETIERLARENERLALMVEMLKRRIAQLEAELAKKG